MSQVILGEVHFLLKSMILGLGLRGAYDVFKLRRALTRCHPALLAAEDTVYWMLCSLFVFGLLYEENNGTLRGFALCGVAAGMLVWHFGPSPILVAGLARLCRFLGKILIKPVKILGKALKKVNLCFKMKIKPRERGKRHAEKKGRRPAQKKKKIQ